MTTRARIQIASHWRELRRRATEESLRDDRHAPARKELYGTDVLIWNFVTEHEDQILAALERS
jgi:hypothetical protein